MNKYIFLLLLSLVFLTGCNKTEVVTVKDLSPLRDEDILAAHEEWSGVDETLNSSSEEEPSIEEKYIIDVNDTTIPSELINKYIEFEKNETKNYINNADIFIELFKLKKLKTFKNFKIGENEIFITGVDKNPDLKSDTLECGQYIDLGGTKMYDQCLAIIKGKNGEITLKYGDIIKADYIESLHEVIENKYLLQKFSTGDGCIGEMQYTLFDENLNKINFIHNQTTGCFMGDIQSKNYEMGHHFINITNNNYLTYGTFEEGQDSEGQNSYRRYTIKRQILSNTKKIEVDMKKNILSGKEKGFYLNIDGKEEKLTFSENQNDSPAGIFKNEKQYFFSSPGFMFLQADIKSKQDFTIKGLVDKSLLFPGENEEIKNKSITKIQILSCINNTDIYDTNWYNLQSLKVKKDSSDIYEFEYNIHEKYVNICSMNTPYKIRFFDESGKITESSFIINLQ